MQKLEYVGTSLKVGEPDSYDWRDKLLFGLPVLFSTLQSVAEEIVGRT